MEKRPWGRGLVVLGLAFRYAYHLCFLSFRTFRPLAAD